MDDASVRFLPLEELRRRRSVKWRTYDEDVLPLWVAEMDVALAPAVVDALTSAVTLGDTGYVHAGDLPATYASFSARRYGWAPDPARISLVPDVMAGIAGVLRVATATGDGVVITPPVYPPFWDFIAYAGRCPVEVPLLRGDDGYAFDLDGLERAFAAGAAALLLCNPHNPTGSVWTRADLDAVADLATRHDILVLADEVHAPLTYPGVAHVPFLSLPQAAARGAVALVAASKGWNLPGLKAGMAVAGVDAAPDLTALPHPLQVGTGMFGVIAAHAAFGSGEAWLDALLVHLDRHRRLVADLLADDLPQVGYRVPEGTYLAWLDCRGLGLGDDPASVFLERGRVALNAGATFGAQGRGYVRLNLATSPELLTEAVRRMAAAVAS